MGLLSRFESKLGLTRSDVTVTLFIAAVTLVGFVYTTFFDDRSGTPAHRELLALMARHDSVVAAYRQARMTELRALLAAPDSVPAWTPPGALDAAADELGDALDRASSGSGKKLPAEPVDLNSAPKTELMKLPGVGAKTADAIILRRRHDPFRRAEDIMQVKGIGQKKFEKMKSYIVVR